MWSFSQGWQLPIVTIKDVIILLVSIHEDYYLAREIETWLNIQLYRDKYIKKKKNVYTKTLAV